MCIIESMKTEVHCEGCDALTEYLWISDHTAECVECGHKEHL